MWGSDERMIVLIGLDWMPGKLSLRSMYDTHTHTGEGRKQQEKPREIYYGYPSGLPLSVPRRKKKAKQSQADVRLASSKQMQH